MSHESQNIVADMSPRSRAAVVSLIILSSAALSLCGTSVGCARPPQGRHPAK